MPASAFSGGGGRGSCLSGAVQGGDEPSEYHARRSEALACRLAELHPGGSGDRWAAVRTRSPPGRVEGGAVAGLRNRRIARPGGRSSHREGAQGSPDVRRGGRTGRWSRSGPAGANPKHAQDRPASLGAVRVSSVRTAPRLEGSRAPTSSPYWLRSGMGRRKPLDGSASPSASMTRLRSAMEGLLRCGGLRSASLTSSFRRRVRLAGRLPCGPRASTGSDRRSRAARQASAASRRSAIPSRPEASARPRRTADSAGPEARRDDTRRRPGTVPAAGLRRVLLDRDRPVVLPDADRAPLSAAELRVHPAVVVQHAVG